MSTNHSLKSQFPTTVSDQKYRESLNVKKVVSGDLILICISLKHNDGELVSYFISKYILMINPRLGGSITDHVNVFFIILLFIFIDLDFF